MPADTTHPVFIQPQDPDIPVWRFMDFAKFANLLLTSAIYFPRLDRLGDTFEGAISPRTFQVLETELRMAFSDNHPPEEAEEGVRAALVHIRKMYKMQRQWAYVSCWHANPNESAAMWSLYTRTSDSIAIRSTYRRLCEVLPGTAYVGSVHYVDFENVVMDRRNLYGPLLMKRRSYEHEREVRALIYETPMQFVDGGELHTVLSGTPDQAENVRKSTVDWRENPSVGRAVQVDLKELLTDVFVAPSSPDWFHDTVQILLKNAGIRTHVHRSSLEYQPLW
jgi:hypothetical protein